MCQLRSNEPKWMLEIPLNVKRDCIKDEANNSNIPPLQKVFEPADRSKLQREKTSDPHVSLKDVASILDARLGR